MKDKPPLHIPTDADAPAEIDHSRADGADYEALSRDRIEVGSLARDDLADVQRIDQKITGRARADYMAKKLEEALLDSAIRVSLVARLDGMVAGFVMARLDFGDFGHMEPVAAIDTIGVDPAFAGEGVGKAMVSQLLANLAALGVEQVETTVADTDLELLGFLYASGFQPSARLAFDKKLA